MNHAEKMLDDPSDIKRGDIIRCKGCYPYEEIVDFMVSETPGERSYCLMVSSGYKAGLVFVILPRVSVPTDNPGYAISKKWMIKNWEQWGYSECSLDDVYLISNSAPRNFDD